MTERDARPVESPARLFWRQLRKSPLAVAGGVLLIALYGMSALAPFLAPYAESDIDRERFFHPPTPLHFRHADGRWTLRPFVYGSRGGQDQAYEPDRTTRVSGARVS
jgi:peptide/nickel transport system permease protein